MSIVRLLSGNRNFSSEASSARSASECSGARPPTWFVELSEIPGSFTVAKTAAAIQAMMIGQRRKTISHANMRGTSRIGA